MERIAALCFLAFFSACSFAFAQESGESALTLDQLRPEPTAPYDAKLLRLSEVLGSIHYLRNLCAAGDGSKWRDAMNKIIVSEKPGPKRRAKLIARFNRGYRAFDETYGTCTGSAVAAANRYVEEGAQLASQITSRYGR